MQIKLTYLFMCTDWALWNGLKYQSWLLMMQNAATQQNNLFIHRSHAGIGSAWACTQKLAHRRHLWAAVAATIATLAFTTINITTAIETW